MVWCVVGFLWQVVVGQCYFDVGGMVGGVLCFMQDGGEVEVVFGEIVCYFMYQNGFGDVVWLFVIWQ